MLISFCTAFWAGAQKHHLSPIVGIGKSFAVNESIVNPNFGELTDYAINFGLGYSYQKENIEFGLRYRFFKTQIPSFVRYVTRTAIGWDDYNFIHLEPSVSYRFRFNNFDLGPELSVGFGRDGVLWMYTLYSTDIGAGLNFGVNRFNINIKYHYFPLNYSRLSWKGCEYEGAECKLSLFQVNLSYLFELQKKK